MFSHRDLTLFGSNALFLGIAALLFLHPGWGLVVFPLFSLIYFWSDFRLDEEMHVIFIFLATTAALLLMSVSNDASARIGVGVELLGVWGVSLGLGLHRSKLAAERQRVMGTVQQLESAVKDLERDIKFYGAYEQTAAMQINLRKDLTEAAKSLGTTMDAKEVQLRLVRILETRYQGSRANILPGQPEDPVVLWSMTTRASVLIKDVKTDQRFRAQPAGAGSQPAAYPYKSAIVAPIMVTKRPFGFLRLESDKLAAFTADDLRTVDLFTTLTSLTLENIRFFESVNDLATHDALTQLFTHKAFQNRLQEELLRGGRAQTPVGLLMCDVDHFKRYNDTYGHQAGDMLLQKVAAMLVSFARPVDFVARYGGEEFCIILPGMVRAQVAELANRIRMKIEGEPFMFQGQRTQVTQSCGVSSFPQDATTPSQLVRAVDERLYKAKTGGRNRVISE